MTFRLPHLLAALTLHILLFGLLAGGLQCTRVTLQPTVINAVLLDPNRQEVAQQERRLKEADAQRRIKAEVEARKKQEAEAQRQRQAAEKKAAAQRTADQKKKADEAAKKKRAQEAAEAARLEQALREEAVLREAEREALARAASAHEAKLADWAVDLVRHIKQYYATPPGTPENSSCKVNLQLLPNGTVKSVKTVTSCGSPVIDRALENAVYRSSPVPVPEDASVFDPDLTINFTP